MLYNRYAIFFTPPDGAFADFGARWLGWDIANAVTRSHPQINGTTMAVDQITQSPRRYGFHATIKPPFHLAAGKQVEDLMQATRTVATQFAPVLLDGLELAAMGRFLALVPTGKSPEMMALASAIVQGLDEYRAPPDQDEIIRRTGANLTDAQKENLGLWGYPYVLNQFRFHMTLTGKLSKSDLAAAQSALAPVVSSLISQPLLIASLTLVGEDRQGMFREIQRFNLTG